MRDYTVSTRRGTVIFTAQRGIEASSRPAVIMFHGAFRAARDFLPLAPHLVGVDPIYARLPDHEGPALDEISLKAYVEAFTEAIEYFFSGRKVLAIGESFGGLIALGLPVQGIVAFDPPFSTGKQWALQDLIGSSSEKRSARARHYFGIDDISENIDYWYLIDRLEVPALIVVGSERLGQRRPIEATPSMLDDYDIQRLTEHPLVKVRIVPNTGHVILGVNNASAFSAVLDAVRAWLSIDMAAGAG